MTKSQPLLIPTILTLLHFPSPSISPTFTITNNCPNTIWPNILSNAGAPPLDTTGFSLLPSQSLPLPFPPSWSGRLWARTHCSTNSSTNSFSCAPSPPATLAEFTLNGSDGLDFFDVSLVDGYNLPVIITPLGGGNCSASECLADVNERCPEELRLVVSGFGGRSLACRSACEAFGRPEFCCSGEYGNPDSCRPSVYSRVFKSACPRAYSYAYDDASSTFTCPTGGDYVVSFCASSSR